MKHYTFKDGTKITASCSSIAKTCYKVLAEFWHGIRGLEFIAKENPNDSLVVFNGNKAKAKDIEDQMRERYNEDCASQNKKPSDSDFERYMKLERKQVLDLVDRWDKNSGNRQGNYKVVLFDKDSQKGINRRYFNNEKQAVDFAEDKKGGIKGNQEIQVWDVKHTNKEKIIKKIAASAEVRAQHKVVSANKHPLHEKAVTLCSMLGKKDGSRKFKAYIDYDGPNDEYIMVKTSKFYDTLGSIEITLYPENNKIGIYCRTFDIEIRSMPEKDFSVKTEKEAVAYVLKVYNAFDKFYETIKDASNKLSDAIRNK